MLTVSACIIAAWPRASIPYPDPFSANNLIPGPGSEHNKHFTGIPQLRSRPLSTFGCIMRYLARPRPDAWARTTPINCMLATIYVPACENNSCNNSGDTESVMQLQGRGERERVKRHHLWAVTDLWTQPATSHNSLLTTNRRRYLECIRRNMHRVFCYYLLLKPLS